MPSPVSEEYLNQYLPYLMADHVEETETYTYGQRLTKYPIPKELINKMDKVQQIFNVDIECWENPNIIKEENGQYYLNQIEWLIWTYKNKGYRNNQMTLQVGHPADMILLDPPCLRQIDTRIQDGKLHFYPNFRSWDLYSGLPNNLAAIQLLKEYIGSCIGVEDGEIVATSKGLHLYDYSIDFAKCLRMKDDMGYGS
jgi:thymidylate synthase